MAKRTRHQLQEFYESLLSDSSGTLQNFRNAVKYFNHRHESVKAETIKKRMKTLYKISKKGGNKINAKESCLTCKHTIPENHKYAMTKQRCNNSKSVKFGNCVSHKETCSKREQK